MSESLTDELYEISENTNNDGTVTATIDTFKKKSYGNEVKVIFEMPGGEMESETMDWPKRDSKEYKFVRLCRATVGGLENADWLKAGEETVRVDPETMEIQLGSSIRRRASTVTPNVSLGDALVGISKLGVIVTFVMLSVAFIGSLISYLLSIIGILAVSETAAGLFWLSFVPVVFGTLIILMARSEGDL